MSILELEGTQYGIRLAHSLEKGKIRVTVMTKDSDDRHAHWHKVDEIPTTSKMLDGFLNNNCYCVCHTPIASCAYCDHCKNSVDVAFTQFGRQLQEKDDEIERLQAELKKAQESVQSQPGGRLWP